MSNKSNSWVSYLFLIGISVVFFIVIIGLSILIAPKFESYPIWCQYLIVGIFLFIPIWLSLLFFSSAELIKKKHPKCGYSFVILSQLSVFSVAWLTKDLDANLENFVFLFIVTVFLPGAIHYWFGDKLLKLFRISS